jgi:DNA polymerase-3 subunit gamma/tau
MTYQVLARKWRPRRFEEVVGQDVAVRALSNALSDQRLHPALLFSGTRGVGKTSLARIVAKALNCEQGVGAQPCGTCDACREIDEGRFVDLIEVDAASRTRVDDTRELLDNVLYAPARGRYKVYLVDEVHMLSQHSFNALLKTLEEPPPHVIFLLATTDPQKLPVTILSRCLQFHLGRVPAGRIQAHLGAILESESVDFDQDAARLVAEAADGSLRDGLSLLDQAIAFAGGRLDAAPVREMLGTIAPVDLYALVQALADNDPAALLAESHKLAEQVADYEAVLNALAQLLQRLAVAEAMPDASPEGDAAERGINLHELAPRLGAEAIQLYYQMAVLGRRDMQWAPDPATGFEMTLLRMAAFRPELDEAAASPEAGTAPGQQPSGQCKAAAQAPDFEKPVATPAEGGDSAAPSQDWGGLLKQIKLGGMAGQLARHCRLAEQSEKRLVLRLDPAYRQLLSERAQQGLEQALQNHFGEPLQVAVEVGGEGEGETPAQADTRAAQARYRDAETAIEEDPTVNDLKKRFGAHVLADSIQPLDGEAANSVNGDSP